jgi:DNA-damage-inducible protein D
MSKRQPQIGMNTLLSGDQVRRLERDGKNLYSLTDLIAVLTGTTDPAEQWSGLKQCEPQLAKLTEVAAIRAADGSSEAVEMVDLAGVLRLVQAIPSPRAEKLKTWLARTAVERMAEAQNPELAVLRTRKLYESRGYSRRWVDKRLRGVSARHELTGEWYKRGATESDQFRALTNTIMQVGFGMDVEGYRRHKGLFKTGENLRDHMSDLELALTALGETAAVALHRDRDSHEFGELLTDATDAGEIVARTRTEIEQRLERSIVEAGNHRGWWAGRKRPLPGKAAPADAASKAQESTDPEPGPRVAASGTGDKAVA